jgi:16S rRNA (cytidine1402-2'-O)-methyltransferase
MKDKEGTPGTEKSLVRGTLYIVATPIGNLKDITLRALDILRSVEAIACEDTRQTGKLLAHYGIKKNLISYFEYNKIRRSQQLIGLLKNGHSIALVTDSGTPAISDPGFYIARLASAEGIRISPVPGPSALTAALSASGVPTDRFVFEGFLPPKKTARRNKLASLKKEKRTIIFYESPHRLKKTLFDVKDIFGDITICICRELTKIYEEVKKNKVSELLDYFSGEKQRGEFVVIIPKDKGKPRYHPPLAELRGRQKAENRR